MSAKRLLVVDVPFSLYNEERMKSHGIIDLCGDLDFKLIMACIAVKMTSDIAPEMSAEEIAECEGELPEMQCNTAYFFCSPKEINPKSDILRKLKYGANLPYESYNYVIPQALPVSCRAYNRIKRKIRKDIVFHDINEREIGWYNSYTNILWISDLLADYRYNSYEATRLVLSIIKEFKEGKRFEDTSIGADPEFEIVDLKLDRNIRPGEFIEDSNYVNPIGIDRFPEIGELRPKPALGPKRLVRNVKRLIRILGREIIPARPHIRIYAGGGKYRNVGGHIHFPQNFMQKRVKHILHDLVSSHIREGMNSRRKTEGRYMDRDGFDAIRKAEAHSGCEWRALPSWIVSEEVASVIVSVVYAVYDSILNGILTEASVKKKGVIPSLRSLRLYPFYNKEIETFIEMFVTNKTSLEEIDIRKGWHAPMPEPANVIIASTYQWMEYIFPPIRVEGIDPSIIIEVFVDIGGADVELTLKNGDNIDKFEDLLNNAVMFRCYGCNISVEPHMECDAMLLIPYDLFFILHDKHKQNKEHQMYNKVKNDLRDIMQKICNLLIDIKHQSKRR